MDYIITTSEYCERVADGTHETPKPCTEGFPLVTSKNINGGVLNMSSTYLISNDDYDSVNKRSKVEQWDILFSMIGSVGEVYIEREANPQYAIKNLGLFKMDGNKEKALNLYYYLKSSFFQKKLRFWLSGSIQSFVPLSFLRNIKLPNFNSETSKLVNEIEMFADKISNNSSLISNLEEYSQLLFHKWFVDFNFPNNDGNPHKDAGGEMVEVDGKMFPYGWKRTNLGDYLSFDKGISYTSQEIDEEENGIPMLNLNSFNRSGGYKAEGIKFYTGKYTENKLLKPYDLVVACTDVTRNADIIGAPVFVPELNGEKYLGSCDVAKIVIKNNMSKFYLSQVLQHGLYKKYIKGFANGTNVLHLELKGISMFKSVIPTIEIMEKFGSIIEIIEKKKSSIIKENKLLEETRDLLIKKLIK